jgi:hypothetical protein
MRQGGGEGTETEEGSGSALAGHAHVEQVLRGEGLRPAACDAATVSVSKCLGDWTRRRRPALSMMAPAAGTSNDVLTDH